MSVFSIYEDVKQFVKVNFANAVAVMDSPKFPVLQYTVLTITGCLSYIMNI